MQQSNGTCSNIIQITIVFFLDQQNTNQTPNVEQVGSPAVIDTTAIETNTTTTATTITTAVAETDNQTETTAAPKPTNANRKKVPTCFNYFFSVATL